MNCLEVYLEVSLPPQNSAKTTFDYSAISLSPSENFSLTEVLPDVPPVVLLDVHLEVITFSDYT